MKHPVRRDPLARPDSVGVARADSVHAARKPAPAAPPDAEPAGRPHGLASLEPDDLRRTTVQDAREAVRDGLAIEFLDPGSHNLPDPLYLGVPGRDVPELRLDGLAVGSVRWPETPLFPVPLLALSSASLRRYAPIDGPLSSTGGPVIDARLAATPNDRAVSAVRLSRGSYGTFTDEIVLRRPVRRVLLDGFYGDSKTGGREPWQGQSGATMGLRIGHRLAGGWASWGVDGARERFHLLATKQGLWDRTAWIARWMNADSTPPTVDVTTAWTWTRGGWWTGRGLTERRTRAVLLRGLGHRSLGRDRASVAVEAEFARTYFHRFDEPTRLYEDLSAGAALGWTRERPAATARVSGGFARLAPLAVAPVFAGEYEIRRARWPRLILYGSRAVRNRTLPRLPADGEAWVRQGFGLADERSGEAPEAFSRLGVEGRIGGGAAARASLEAGCEILRSTRGLGLDEEDLPLLGTDRQEEIPAMAERRSRSYFSPWGRLRGNLPAGFRFGVEGRGTIAEGGVASHLGLSAIRGRAEAGWRGALFSGDLELDLSLTARGGSAAATPYGTLPASGRIDGMIRGRIGEADLFFVLANLTDEIASSMSYESGAFSFLPRRHYRAGVRWFFVD